MQLSIALMKFICKLQKLSLNSVLECWVMLSITSITNTELVSIYYNFYHLVHSYMLNNAAHSQSPKLEWTVSARQWILCICIVSNPDHVQINLYSIGHSTIMPVTCKHWQWLIFLFVTGFGLPARVYRIYPQAQHQHLQYFDGRVWHSFLSLAQLGPKIHWTWDTRLCEVEVYGYRMLKVELRANVKSKMRFANLVVEDSWMLWMWFFQPVGKRHRIRRMYHISTLQHDRKESTLLLCIALYMGCAGNQSAGDCACLGSLLFDLHGWLRWNSYPVLHASFYAVQLWVICCLVDSLSTHGWQRLNCCTQHLTTAARLGSRRAVTFARWSMSHLLPTGIWIRRVQDDMVGCPTAG